MDTKTIVIGSLLAISNMVISWQFMTILKLLNQQTILVSEVTYINKEVSNCIKRDVYELEKMLMLEKLKR